MPRSPLIKGYKLIKCLDYNTELPKFKRDKKNLSGIGQLEHQCNAKSPVCIGAFKASAHLLHKLGSDGKAKARALLFLGIGASPELLGYHGKIFFRYSAAPVSKAYNESVSLRMSFKIYRCICIFI